jgi:hypothetical protein
MTIDPKIARELATDCMAIKSGEDGAHLNLNIALLFGWKLKHDVNAEETLYWVTTKPDVHRQSRFVEYDVLPRFTEDLSLITIPLDMLSDKYAYYVVKKGPNAWTASVEWDGGSVGADAYTEVGALFASILFALAVKQEANNASV